jgi:hypothetical protein
MAVNMQRQTWRANMERRVRSGLTTGPGDMARRGMQHPVLRSTQVARSVQAGIRQQVLWPAAPVPSGRGLLAHSGVQLSGARLRPVYAPFSLTTNAHSNMAALTAACNRCMRSPETGRRWTACSFPRTRQCERPGTCPSSGTCSVR